MIVAVTDVDDAIPIRLGQFQKRCAGKDSRVVDQDRDAAQPIRRRQHRLDGVTVGDGALHQFHLRASRPHISGDCFGARLVVQPIDDDGGAGGAERPGDGGADPLLRTGNEGDMAGETVTHIGYS